MTNNDLYSLAESENIAIDLLHLPKNKSLSISLDGKCYIALDNQTVYTDSETKVHLAHELGHCMTGAFYNVYSPLDLREKHEYRANRWAVNNLIPKEKLIELLKCGLERWEIAEYFNVTEEFVNLSFKMYFDYLAS